MVDILPAPAIGDCIIPVGSPTHLVELTRDVVVLHYAPRKKAWHILASRLGLTSRETFTVVFSHRLRADTRIVWREINYP